MLFYSAGPVDGPSIGLASTGLYPPGEAITADEYRGYLRACWRRDPRPFVELARMGAEGDLTLVGPITYVSVLHDALIKVAAANGRRRGAGHCQHGAGPGPALRQRR